MRETFTSDDCKFCSSLLKFFFSWRYVYFHPLLLAARTLISKQNHKTWNNILQFKRIFTEYINITRRFKNYIVRMYLLVSWYVFKLHNLRYLGNNLFDPEFEKFFSMVKDACPKKQISVNDDLIRCIEVDSESEKNSLIEQS